MTVVISGSQNSLLFKLLIIKVIIIKTSTNEVVVLVVVVVVIFVTQIGSECRFKTEYESTFQFETSHPPRTLASSCHCSNIETGSKHYW